MLPDEVELGNVSGVFGFRGEVRLFLYNPKGETLLREMPVILVRADGRRFAGRLKARSGAGKRIIGRFAGITEEAQARALMGYRLAVAKKDLPTPKDDEFYVHALEGLDAVQGGKVIGQILGVHTTDAGEDILEIGGPDQEESWFVPAQKRWITVDLAAGKVLLTDDALDE